MKKFTYIFLIFNLIFFNTLGEQGGNLISNSTLPIIYNQTNQPLTGFIRKGKNISSYRNGVPHGKWLLFHSNGSLKSIANWDNGALNGLYTLYNEKERKILENNYFRGKDHGKYILYHPNGKVYIIGEFHYGKPIGIWLYYSQEGKLTGKNDFTKNNPKNPQQTETPLATSKNKKQINKN